MFIRTGGGLATKAFYNSLEKHYPQKVDVIHYDTKINQIDSNNFHFVPSLSILEKMQSFIKGSIHRFNPWLLRFLNENKNKYSHCIINTGLLGDLIENIQRLGIKVIVIHHNFEVEFQVDNRRPCTLWGLSPFLVSIVEGKSFSQADMNLFLTQDDFNVFNSYYGNNSKKNDHVVGMYEPDMDSHQRKEALTTKNSPHKLVISGSLNSVQTLSGIRDFSEKYLLLLHNIFDDDFELLITGRSPHKKILELSKKDDNIRIVPDPLDISSVIRESCIFICPINVGGGIKLRIMDGLKLGMPILTHSVSARGYNFFYQKPWFKIYDDTQSFINGINDLIRLINSPTFSRSDITNDYQNQFSFHSGDTRFYTILKEFIR